MKCLINTFFLSALFLFCNCNYKKQADTNAPPTQTTNAADSLDTALNIDLKQFINNPNLPATQEISISHDPFFKQSKKFIGFSLQHLLDSIIIAQQFDTTGAVVVFECSDGYRPTMPLAQVLGDKKSFIAIRDLDAPTDKNWLDSLDKKMKPFYVVWQDVSREDHRFTWPYGLVAMQLIPAGTIFKDVYPFDAPAYAAGFQLFNQNCMKCHSVNKVGGVMGPEFNIPKNITEYWTDENIIAFAKNPQSFRYRSTMPPVTGVSDAEFEQILNYLKYIAKHKVEL